MLESSDAQSDPFNLSRFVVAQSGSFDVALSELKSGRKRSHWMWFIFPQLAGLGHSATAQKYAIKSLDEAQAYLEHPILGPRLLVCCRAVLAIQGKSALEIMGYPDDMKLRSSMTLFSLVPKSHDEFAAVLTQYFDGEPDPQTIALLNS